jgi:hypothetical protein
MDGDGANEWMLETQRLNNGEANVFAGSAVAAAGAEIPLPDDATWTLTGSGGDTTSYAGPGDVTGDGLADLVAAAPLSPLQLIAGGSKVPKGAAIDEVAVATFASACGGTPSNPTVAGDLDDDGVAEVVLRTSGGCDDGFHYFQGGSALLGSLDTSAASTFADDAVTRIGDVDGDGWSDLAYGDGVVLGTGKLPSEILDLDVRFDMTTAYGRPNIAGAANGKPAPDLDGDGLGDVVFTDWMATGDGKANAGVLRVLLGRSDWPSTVTSKDVDATFVGTSDTKDGGGGFPTVVSDVDGDGFDDIVFGSTVEGAVYLFFGQP